MENLVKIRKQNIAYHNALDKELTNILNYWVDNTIDEKHGGFVGRISNDNKKITKSSKGVILNSRILWSFSKASIFYGDERYSKICQRAYHYIRSSFLDTKYGGVFWELDYTGRPIDKRKQTYAQAFTIFAFSEYYKYSKDEAAVNGALELFNLIEHHALDLELGGYVEAFSEDWSEIDDLRLSKKDVNAPKTMNTHLHILEAYTTLFEVTNDEKVGKSLKNLVDLFLGKFIMPNGHFHLFFSTHWKSCSSEVSFGHDIEAAWLLLSACRVLKEESLINITENLLIRVVDVFLEEALDDDFGVFNAKNSVDKVFDTDKHWWPQAEAMVGLVYAFNLTEQVTYLDFANSIWGFIENKIIDKKNGEWFFRVDKNGVPYKEEDKVGFWKCPYHNSRACIEIINNLKH